MTINLKNKQELIEKFGANAKDSGSVEVQVAMLSQKIAELTEHLKTNAKDFQAKRGLLMMVGRRKRMLTYIKKSDIEKYRKLIKELNSRKCIYCNEFEIRQVILNILLNAVDSITCDGVVKIKTYDKGKNSFIEVEDTGIGIEEDMLEKIFDPFFTTKGEHGTGLGLNIVKKVLNEHCADIKVESQVNKGSKFTIIFPSTTKEQLKVAEEEEEYKTAANILVVDDKYIVAKSIKELVSLLNMNADVETRGEKVMSRLSEKEYDLIICDYSMPYKNGIEVSQKVKKEYPNKPFILLTGFVDDIVENCDTIDYILNKPCTVEELADTIGKALKIVDEARSKSSNIS